MSMLKPDFNDPITLQVMWDRLVFIADQADSALGRTAFSPIVRENHDYVNVLLDAKGRALAQCTWSIPVFITRCPWPRRTTSSRPFRPSRWSPATCWPPTTR